MRFTGKVVIVTGAGSGIGKATIEAFAAEGAQVVAGEIDGGRLDALVAGISATGAKILGVKGNVGVKEDAEGLVDAAVREFGRLDILVNNAGIMDRFMPIGEVPDELWKRVYAVNVDGVFYTMRRAVAVMAGQGGGVIVNVASAAGLGGGFAGAAYTSSKHAVVGLTRNTAVMYGKSGIRCVAICPGAVNTAIGMGGEPSQAGYAALGPGLGTIPRVGEPAELAAMVLAVAAPDASFLNGAIIPVDGGWLAQG